MKEEIKNNIYILVSDKNWDKACKHVWNNLLSSGDADNKYYYMDHKTGTYNQEFIDEYHREIFEFATNSGWTEQFDTTKNIDEQLKFLEMSKVDLIKCLCNIITDLHQ